MGTVFHALEVHHAIEARKGCATTLVAVRVKSLLREDVSAGLRYDQICSLSRDAGVDVSRRVGSTYLARKRYHNEYFIFEGCRFVGFVGDSKAVLRCSVIRAVS